LALGLAVGSGCRSTVVEPACGEGTVEEDGVCVAEDDDDDGDPTSGSGATEGGRTGGLDDDEGETEGGEVGTSDATGTTGTGTTGWGTTGAAEPYSSCVGGSDVECTVDESCLDELATCAAWCGNDFNCPAPPGGSAVQRCENMEAPSDYPICVLYCGAQGLDCPTGMTCRLTELCEFGWCLAPTVLEICVWA
jgi:hypothetical protein